MGYQLGVDLGSVYTTAALCRRGRAEILPLVDSERVTSDGSTAGAARTALVACAGGSFQLGRVSSDSSPSSEGIVRGFKNSIGSAPIAFDGVKMTAESLAAEVLMQVVEIACESEGEYPDSVAVSYPTYWGPKKIALLGEALRLALVDNAFLVSDAEAVVLGHSADHRIANGTSVLVCDFGAGNFSAAVLLKGLTRWELLAADGHSLDSSRARSNDHEREDSSVLAGCVSSLRQVIRLSKGRSSGVDIVLLVGGNERMSPLALLLSDELSRTVIPWSGGKNLVAIGAALAASDQISGRGQVNTEQITEVFVALKPDVGTSRRTSGRPSSLTSELQNMGWSGLRRTS